MTAAEDTSSPPLTTTLSTQTSASDQSSYASGPDSGSALSTVSTGTSGSSTISSSNSSSPTPVVDLTSTPPSISSATNSITDVTDATDRTSVGNNSDMPSEGSSNSTTASNCGTATNLSIRALVSSKEAGAIIGKSGKNVTEMRQETGVKVGVSKAMTNVQDRIMTVSGHLAGVAEAFGIAAKNLLATVETLKSRYGASAVSYNNVFASDKGVLMIPTPSGMATVRLLIPHQQMGSIIGRQGCKIKSIQSDCHVRMAASKEMLPQSTERIVEIQGTPDSVTKVILEIGQCLYADRDRAQGAILYNPLLVSSLDQQTNQGNQNGQNGQQRSLQSADSNMLSTNTFADQQYEDLLNRSAAALIRSTASPASRGASPSLGIGAQPANILNDGPVTIINNGTGGTGTPGGFDSSSCSAQLGNISIKNTSLPHGSSNGQSYGQSVEYSSSNSSTSSNSSYHQHSPSQPHSSHSHSMHHHQYQQQQQQHQPHSHLHNSLGSEPSIYSSSRSIIPTPLSSSSPSSMNSSINSFQTHSSHHHHHQQQQQQQQSQSHESLAHPVISDISSDSENYIVAADMVGCIIGKGGAKIQDIRRSSGAKISIAKEPYNPGGDCLFTISGSDSARQLVVTWLYEQLRTERDRRARHSSSQV